MVLSPTVSPVLTRSLEECQEKELAGPRHGQGSLGPSTDRCPHRGRERHVPLLFYTPSFMGSWVWAGQAWGGVRKGEGLHKHLLCLWVEFEE